jgi:splicing factor 3B subunit 2
LFFFFFLTNKDYIEATRISEIRKAIEEKDSKKTLKQRMREKVRPRHRKMNIDYQTLHDAFFKYATKPVLTKFGDVYFEGKETEMMFRRYTPGKLSARCRVCSFFFKCTYYFNEGLL